MAPKIRQNISYILAGATLCASAIGFGYSLERLAQTRFPHMQQTPYAPIIKQQETYGLEKKAREEEGKINYFSQTNPTQKSMESMRDYNINPDGSLDISEDEIQDPIQQECTIGEFPHKRFQKEVNFLSNDICTYILFYIPENTDVRTYKI